MERRILVKFNFEVTTLETLTILEALQDLIHNTERNICDREDAVELYDNLKMKIRLQYEEQENC